MNAKERKKLTERRNLTTVERERIVQLNIVNSDKSLLGYILIKYLQFNADNKLNSQNELYQTYDDIRNGLMTGITDNALRAQLKRLVKGDYITYVYKGIEGDKIYRKAIHLSVTNKTINSIMGDDKELKATSNEKYELLQEVRYSNKVKKMFTPEVFKTKVKKSNSTKPVVKSKEKPTDEIVELNTVELIEEPIKQIEELTEPVNDNRTKTNKTKIDKEMKNKKNLEMCEEAKLLVDYKDKINLKNIFHDLDLTVDVVNYLYSSEYIEGVNRKMDDIKSTIDVIINQKINPMRGIPMMFTL